MERLCKVYQLDIYDGYEVYKVVTSANEWFKLTKITNTITKAEPIKEYLTFNDVEDTPTVMMVF